MDDLLAQQQKQEQQDGGRMRRSSTPAAVGDAKGGGGGKAAAAAHAKEVLEERAHLLTSPAQRSAEQVSACLLGVSLAMPGVARRGGVGLAHARKCSCACGRVRLVRVVGAGGWVGQVAVVVVVAGCVWGLGAGGRASRGLGQGALGQG